MNCPRGLSFLFLAAILVLIPAAGFSQNTIFLKNTPLGISTTDDLDSLLVKINETLNSVALDTPVQWKSTDEKVSSTWTVTDNYSKNNRVCRRLNLDTTMNNQTTSRRFGFCNVDSAWLVDID
jgi:hypothetical protein